MLIVLRGFAWVLPQPVAVRSGVELASTGFGIGTTQLGLHICVQETERTILLK